MKIKIKYLPGAHKLNQIEIGDWCDLYTYDDISVQQGHVVYLNLGVAMQLPKGYEAIMAPRSSTCKKWGLLQANSIGVIDNSYSGNDDIWHFPVYALKDIVIPKNTRLCQFRLLRNQPIFSFQEVDSLDTTSRGGLGSTGD